MNKEYSFIVETDLYAGNFERELCAYITGHIGECEVGDGEREGYLSTFENAMEGVILKTDKDDGCRRPVKITCTDKCKGFEALEIYFDKIPDSDSLKTMKERAREYARGNGIWILGFLIKTTSTKTSFEEV